MNHRYLFVAVLLAAVGVMIPYGVFKIRQRRLAESQGQVAGDHVHDDCCSCH